MGSAEEPISVSQLTDLIKHKLEKEFFEVAVEGEISNFKAHPSGHFYFSLKDDKASLSAVMFRGGNAKLKFKVEDGVKVIAIGKITVYPPRGNYQMLITRMEPSGVGALQLAFEQLKKKLDSEGLFDIARKRPLPTFPQVVGLVTSSSGAAIRDILNVIGRRFDGIHCILYPVKVQGEGAAQEIAEAIQHLNKFFPQIQVMIVGRGGGSIEDLWAFNEEVVARAIFGSKIPIISAVGHEVDFTIADFVADLRAPTPSAAAELVVANKVEILHRLDQWVKRLLQVRTRVQMAVMRVDDLSQQLERALVKKLSALELRFEILKGRLGKHSPHLLLRSYSDRLRTQTELLNRIILNRLEKSHSSVIHLTEKLRLLDPRTIMARGYSIVRVLPGQKVVTKASDIKMGDKLLIELAKGKITAKV